MHFLLVLWILMAALVYCLPECGRNFVDTRLLHIHTANCDYVAAANAIAARDRKSAPDARGVYLAKQLAKRQKLNPPEQTQPSSSQSNAGPSSDAMIQDFNEVCCKDLEFP